MFCVYVKPGSRRPGNPCKETGYLPAAALLCDPFGTRRGADLLWKRDLTFRGPVPAGYGAVPHYDDKAGGSN